MTINILIIGYYGHANLGDEQYKLSFTYVIDKYIADINNYNIIFVDCDRLKDQVICSTDIVLLGGGDILNNYFMDQINKTFINRANVIIAASVGMPYVDILLNTDKLNIIDYLFLRTHQDMDLFSKYFSSDRLKYIPDLSIFLINTEKRIITYSKEYYEDDDDDKEVDDNEMTKDKEMEMEKEKEKEKEREKEKEKKKEKEKETEHESEVFLRRQKLSSRKIITFCLNRHIYSHGKDISYFEIVKQFANAIEYLAEKDYFMVLLPFNVQSFNVNTFENDILIHTDVFNMLKDKTKMNVYNIVDRTMSLSQTYRLFSYFDLVVPMRFHACLFSINNKIPFLPIYTTKKIKNLLLDIEWKYSYELQTDICDIPLEIDWKLIVRKISEILRENFNSFFYVVCRRLKNEAITSSKQLMKVMIAPKRPRCAINYPLLKINQVMEKIQIYLKVDNIILSDIKDRSQQNVVVDIISYYLTNELSSKYNAGVAQKAFIEGYNYVKEWTWIIKDYLKHEKEATTPNSKKGLFNMNFVNQHDSSDSHRSGWQYVIYHMKQLNNNNSNVMMDLSIDKTFHWKEQSNLAIGILPYVKPWMGFLHHTFDTSFSDYNNTALLKKKSFRDSLYCCRGIYVFSHVLKNQLHCELQKIGFAYIPIHCLMHPTEYENIKRFTWDNFLANSDKKIVHIGGWLRNIFSFYNLNIPREYTFKKSNMIHITTSSMVGKITRVVLKGRQMNNYFPHNHQLLELDTQIKTVSTSNSNAKTASSDDTNNNWNKHCNEFINHLCNDIIVQERLNNEQYDYLLSENIVFINLVDASAVNTVLECIVRNTPIVINRHPAVVEMLGIHYPLYFGDNYGKMDSAYAMNSEIEKLLSDTINIKHAYKYMLQMDKSKFMIDYFITKLKETL